MQARPTILVTGAGGFLGGRVCEILDGGGVASVRAGVRRWSSAARVGRLPVEIVTCDVRDLVQVERAVAGATAVVHCAVGDRAVTVDGTRNVLEASARHGVKRVVHISTIAVYGAKFPFVAAFPPAAITYWKITAGWVRMIDNTIAFAHKDEIDLTK